ncbi:MAG: hypothetical protein E4G77_02575 [Nitrosopumilus sp.]|nr:MAG: hypothetical protein E4G77_02575 [Nitrosopumilus sp.]
MNKGQHAMIISGMLIALLAVAIPLSSESFAKPNCIPWPECKNGDGGSGGGGKTSFDFDIVLSENSVSIDQGNSDNITVTVSQKTGTGNVNLSAPNVPAGVTVSFSPTSSKISSNNPSYTSTMTIDVSSTGSYGPIEVQASGKGTTKPATLNLDVSDNTAPQTTINSKPTDPSNDNNSSFTFSADEPATFECSVDGSNFAACISGDSFGPLDDGQHTFQVKAIDSADNTDSTPASYTWTIETSLPTPDDPVIVAVGDMACNTSPYTSSTCRHAQTSDQMMSINPDAVLTLGDNQYQNGEISNYTTYYHPTWGRAFDKTYPSPGNHEYGTYDAAGYLDYFGTRTGDPQNKFYYSFDIGSWHIVSLNSNCSEELVGGCSTNSPQGIWLKNDLETHNNACTLVYWHHPRYSAGSHGDNSKMDYFWQLLDANNVDVALAGHDHNYQRFAPMDLTGSADPNGVREFVVGTGGKSHYSLNSTDNNLEAFNTSTFGVLKMTLHDTSYEWMFEGESGNVIDSGNYNCNVN